MTNLEGKWALVTGASRGIGYEVSLGLAKLGCRVVIHSRTEQNCARIANELKEIGAKYEIVAAELSDQTQVDALAQAAIDKAGQIDILYNNAAIQTAYHPNPWTFEPEEFRRCFEINVIAIIRLCQHLAPPMLERGWGRIINVTSGVRDQPEQSPYATSKAALDKYVYDFAPKLKGTGVTMNVLDPGWLKTDMGGPHAPGDVRSVLPGALIPALKDDGITGHWYNAQQYAEMTLEEALNSP